MMYILQNTRWKMQIKNNVIISAVSLLFLGAAARARAIIHLRRRERERRRSLIIYHINFALCAQRRRRRLQKRLLVWTHAYKYWRKGGASLARSRAGDTSFVTRSFLSLLFAHQRERKIRNLLPLTQPNVENY